MSSRSSSDSGGRAMPWVLLHRAPRISLSEPAAGGMASDADLVIELVPPPGVSTAIVRRDLLPEDADCDTEPFRVEGADASGHLLLAMPTTRPPGLVVFRPVPVAGTRLAVAAKGEAQFLPVLPHDVLVTGLDFSPTAATGIIADHPGGKDCFVVQLHAVAGPGPFVAAALSFSSAQHAWTVKQVAADERWRAFHADSVVSHDRGDCGKPRVVFVDRAMGLLRFHPQGTDSMFVDLPELAVADQGGHASVDSTQGMIVYLAWQGTRVRLWALDDGETWRAIFQLQSDEILNCDEQLLRLHPLQSIGPIDPRNPTRVFLTLGAHRSSTVCVEVIPGASFGHRAVLDDVQTQRGNDHSPPLVCDLSAHASGARGWMAATVDRAINIAMMAGNLAHAARPHMHKLPAAVTMVGSALSLPMTPALIGAAETLDRLNQSVDLAEGLGSYLSNNMPGANSLWGMHTTVGTVEEAKMCVQFWKDEGKPSKTVRLAPGVTPGQIEGIRDVFRQDGAECLIEGGDLDDYILVDRAPKF